MGALGSELGLRLTGRPVVDEIAEDEHPLPALDVLAQRIPTGFTEVAAVQTSLRQSVAHGVVDTIGLPGDVGVAILRIADAG
jgi:hypothetical protein